MAVQLPDGHFGPAAALVTNHQTAAGGRPAGRASRTEQSAITPEKIDCLAAVIREALRNDDPGFRKAYLRLFVGKVVVDDNEIRMSGPTAALEQAASAGGLPTSTALVPSFVRKWYPMCDESANWEVVVTAQRRPERSSQIRRFMTRQATLPHCR
jgi:hypothetical protein